MKDQAKKASMLFVQIIVGALEGNWDTVKRSAEQAKQLFIETDRHEFSADKDESEMDAEVRYAVGPAGQCLAKMKDICDKLYASNDDKYFFLPKLDDIIEVAKEAIEIQGENAGNDGGAS